MASSTDARIAGVILAAGASSRMGRPKQLLDIGGKPLLQRVLDEASASTLSEIVIVLGNAAPQVERALRLPERARVVVNARHAEGVSTSLIAGVRALDDGVAAAAVLLGDTVVPAQLIDHVIAVYGGGAAAVVRPAHIAGVERVPGHPVIVAREIWPYLFALRGDRGLRDVIAAQRDWLTELEVEAPAPTDIDTPEDYARARARVRGDNA
jgi:molybdenum cofactor cytidylyltransferase